MALKLKSIELQGYKTFAHKTRFEFPMPITAIVGPNGSGKSNIADAIRWVLGEQSYSLLRGRKTMDMIFTGSDQKARAGMATASILFDNQDEWLPIDYEEVNIVRRAYRSGENDYLVNGQRMRLKDINELLGQSGLAERTYTIIGQGLIDSALSLKPDDRRRFFEEAAGIGLFRSRREEALNRLEITHRNLERIADILGELEPRLHSLQRQSKRAVEYEQVKKDLTVLLRDWYGYHWHKAQQSLVEAIRLSESQETKTGEIHAEYAGLESQSAAIQEAVRVKRLRLGELHNQLAEIHHKLDSISRETAVLDERLNATRRQAAGFIEEADVIQAEIDLLQERKAQFESDQTELAAASVAALEQKAAVEAELKAKTEELNALQSQRNQQRTLLTQKETALIRMKAQRDEMQNRLESLVQSSESLQTALKASQTELVGFQENQQLYQTQLSALESELASFDQKQTELREQIRQLETQRTEQTAKFSQTQTALSRAKAQLDVLSAAEKNLTGLNQGAQFLLKNASQRKEAKKRVSLGSCFLFPKEVEIAAAAVLGENLDAVLMDPADWQGAITLLNGSDHGRAVLIAEQFAAKAALPPTHSKIRALRSLRDSVCCDAPYQPLAERLFGAAYLVDSPAQALELQPLLQPHETLVTLAGDTFRANGSVVTGNEHKHQLLSRKREMKELEQSIAALSAESSALQTALQELEAQYKNSQKLSEVNAEKRKRHSQQLDQIRRNLNQSAMETQKREQLIQFQQQRIQENEKQTREINEKKGADSAVIAGLEAELTGYQEAVRALSDQIRLIQLDDLQRQAHHWSLEWTITEKSRKENETRIADLGGQLARNAQRLAQNQSKSESVTQQGEQISQQREALQLQAAETSASAQAIEAEILPEENELQQLETHLEQAQAEFQTMQAKTSASDKLLVQGQMEVARLQDQLDALKQRIEDDFGLVAFEFKEKIAGQTPLPLGEVVEQLPHLEELPEELKDQISRQKGLMHRMGAINPDAIAEFEEVSERYSFLKTQSEDLKKADRDLREVITELDEMMQSAFQTTFDKVQTEFKTMFSRLFGGGAARLVLTDPENINQSGIDIEAKLPGRREQELSLLSGGERSLTSVALVFALLRVSPTPFCVMDEVDAALDEANVGRFCELLKELSQQIQFIVITHNRNTVETADVIYGITMGRDSASQVVSLRLDEINKDYLI